MSPVGLILIAFLFAGFWLVVVRPQRRAKTRRADMVAALGIGSEVVTVGGLYGTVRELADDTIDLEVASGVICRFDRRAVGHIVEPPAPAEAAEDVAVGLPAAQPSQPTSR